MMTVGLNKLDLKKLKRSQTKAELCERIQYFKQAEEKLKDECQRRGITKPIIMA